MSPIYNAVSQSPIFQQAQTELSSKLEKEIELVTKYTRKMHAYAYDGTHRYANTVDKYENQLQEKGIIVAKEIAQSYDFGITIDINNPKQIKELFYALKPGIDVFSF